jgi:hypothetical protein
MAQPGVIPPVAPQSSPLMQVYGSVPHVMHQGVVILPLGAFCGHPYSYLFFFIRRCSLSPGDVGRPFLPQSVCAGRAER